MAGGVLRGGGWEKTGNKNVVSVISDSVTKNLLTLFTLTQTLKKTEE